MQRDSSSVTRPVDPPRGVAAAVALTPAWFEAALADAPERSKLLVDGVEIEVLCWGPRGRPGLLLLHGFTAHADWWSFVAPQLRRGRRVVAFSLSGMGRSGWRDTYPFEQYVREALAVAEATGLFESPQPPVLIGHSFGSFVARGVAREAGARLGGIILVDGAIAADGEDVQFDGVRRRGHRHRVYPELVQALARFRFSPPQSCDNSWIVDFLAHTSLCATTDADGAGGWSWCFDPDLRVKVGNLPSARELVAVPCRASLLFGDRSLLMSPPRVELLRQLTPPQTPWIEIPDAGHHIMVDQPLALVAAVRAQLEAWQPAALLDLEPSLDDEVRHAHP